MSTLAPRRSSGFGNAILGIFAIAILGCAIAVPVFYKQISEGLGWSKTTDTDGDGSTTKNKPKGLTITSGDKEYDWGIDATINPTPILKTTTTDGKSVVNGSEITYITDDIPSWLALNGSTGVVTGTVPVDASTRGVASSFSIRAQWNDESDEQKIISDAITYAYTFKHSGFVLGDTISDQTWSIGTELVGLSDGLVIKDESGTVVPTNNYVITRSNISTWPIGVNIDSFTGAITGTPSSGKSGTLYIDINGVGSEYSGVSTTGIELLDYTLNQSEIVFLNSPPNLSIILSSAINQTPVLKVKDKSNNSLVNGTNVKYSIVGDTSGAFAADAGLSINADTGVISGTPATGKSIKTGTFKVKATPVASTDWANCPAIETSDITITLLQGTIKFPTTYVGIPESLTLDIGVLHPTSPTEVQVLDASDVAIENNGINLVYSVVEDTTGLFTDGLNGGGLMIVPTTGIIIGTPKKGKTGTFSIKVTPGATSEYKNASAITCTAIKVTVRHDKIEFKTNSLISNNQNWTIGSALPSAAIKDIEVCDESSQEKLATNVVGDSSADPPVVAVPTVTYSIVDDSTGLFATDETIGATAIATAKAATIGSADWLEYYVGGVIINPNTGALAGKPSKGKSGKFKIKVDGVTGGDWANVASQKTADIVVNLTHSSFELVSGFPVTRTYSGSGADMTTTIVPLEFSINTKIPNWSYSGVLVKDESGNTVPNNVGVSYSVISDTTGLFSEGGGLSIQTSTGLIVGTPLNGKSGSFKIKASGITGSNWANVVAVETDTIDITLKHLSFTNYTALPTSPMSLKVGTEVSKTRAIKLVDESGNEMTSTAATSDDVLYSIIEDSTGLFAIDASKTVPDTEKANPDTIGGAVWIAYYTGGLRFDKYTGQIDGIPANGKSGSFKIRATSVNGTDWESCHDIDSDVIAINLTHKSISYKTPPASTLNFTVDTQITSTNSLAIQDESGNTLSNNGDAVTYSIIEDDTNLFKSEGGLSMDTLTGVISGKPLKGKSGTFKIKATGVSATNWSGCSVTSSAITINLNHTSISFVTSSLPNSPISLTIGTVITATNALQTRDESLNTLGSSDVSYSIVDDNTGLFNTGGGLSINTATGVISGTPTIGKSGTFKIKAIGTVGTNWAGKIVTSSVIKINVLHTSLSFTASFLPSRVATKIDQYYDVELSELQVKDESGNIVPNSSLNFEVKPDNDTSDLFSNGMTLNSLGQVIGTPVGGQDGTFKITATGKNSTDWVGVSVTSSAIPITIAHSSIDFVDSSLPVASGAKLQLKIGTTMTATTALSVTDDRVNALTNGTHVTYSIYQPTETTGLFATDESLTPTDIAAAKAANPGTTAYNKYYTGGLVINPSTGVITGQPNKGSGGSVKIVATGKNSTSWAGLEVISRAIQIELTHTTLKLATDYTLPTITTMIDEDIEQTAALSIVDESDNVVSGNAGKYGKFSVLDGDGSGNLTNLFKADGGLTISETTGVISGAPSSYATLKVKTGKFRIKFTPTDNANLLDVYKNLSYTSTACSATINAYHTSLEFDLSSLPNPGTDNCPSGIPMPGNSGLKYTIDTTISNTAAIKVKDETGAQVPNLNLKYTIGTNSDTTDLFKAGGGLNINVDTGVISGKPTKGKTGGFKITATPKANTLWSPIDPIMSPTIFTSVTRKAASAFTSSTSNPSAGTPLAVVLGVDLSVADLELYDSLGYIVPLGNYGATVSVTSDTNKFFSGTGHLGLTLSSSGIFGGQISTASWTTSGLSTGTPYSVTIQFKGVVGYEWASVTALNYTFNITVSAAT